MANSIDTSNRMFDANASAGATTNKASSALDKEAFLKLLVAQISHQDPLKPMEGTEFVSQLSQFAVVEQALAQSKQLDTVSAQLGGLANNEAAQLVGKQVSLRGRALSFDGSLATSTTVGLGAAAEKVSVTIRDAQGNAVRTMDLGPKGGGPLPISWDGKDDSGIALSRGTYTVDVKATDAAGNAVAVAQEMVGVVAKVSYEKGYAELVLDNGASGPVSDVVSVATAKSKAP